jgi:multidrug efflux pump subunit AcrA (membrane-fusion protein)
MAVELDVNNRDGRLEPGTFCQVRWHVRRTGPSLLVPGGSVASTTGRLFVVRIRNGRTEWVDVKTGLTSGALIEVFGDLQPGDEIAARGTDELRAGTAVGRRRRSRRNLTDAPLVSCGVEMHGESSLALRIETSTWLL